MRSRRSSGRGWPPPRRGCSSRCGARATRAARRPRPSAAGWRPWRPAGCCAAGWLLGGPALGLLAALAGPAVVLGVVRRGGAAGARSSVRRRRPVRARWRTRSPPGARSAARSATRRRGARGGAGHELRAAARALALGEPTEAVLVRLRARARAHAWDTLVAAILLQRDAGGDLAGLLRELAAAHGGRRARGARRPHGHRPGALHGLARARPSARRRRARRARLAGLRRRPRVHAALGLARRDAPCSSRPSRCSASRGSRGRRGRDRAARPRDRAARAAGGRATHVPRPWLTAERPPRP